MKEKVRFLGLDVHAETIAVAVAEPDGEVRSLGTIPNSAESIRTMIRKLGTAEKLRGCYEGGKDVTPPSDSRPFDAARCNEFLEGI